MKSTIAKDHTKTEASYRRYPVPEEIKSGLDALKSAQAMNREVFGGCYIDTDYCFTWEDVQEWVGHSDISTTMNIYAQTNEQQKLKTANSMAETIFGSKEKDS